MDKHAMVADDAGDPHAVGFKYPGPPFGLRASMGVTSKAYIGFRLAQVTRTIPRRTRDGLSLTRDRHSLASTMTRE